MKPKYYIKRKWKLGRVHIHRNVIDKKRENEHSHRRIRTYTWASTCSCFWENYKVYQVFFLRTLLSFHPNLDAFLLYTHVWPHIPREVITIGRCNISRPQVKVLPLLGIIETSEDWQILIYKGMLILCWNFRCHESGIFSF